MEPDYQSIGKRLQEARKEAHLTQQALADLMGVSVSYIKSTERGNKPSIKYLFTVANTCQVSFDWLLIGIQNSPRSSTEEYIFDSDTRDMIETIKLMMSDPDPEIHIWAKIQFRRAFAEYFDKMAEKKEHA